MATVFLSYSRKDLLKARAVHDAIAGTGLMCLRDEKWLAPGDDFAEEITRAIRQCDAFVLLLSPASNASDYVCKEVAIAHHFHRPIIPVLLGESDLADCLLPYVVRLQMWKLTKDSVSEFASHLLGRFRVDSEAPAIAASPADRRGQVLRPQEGSASNATFNLVSNREYCAFLQDTRRHPPPHWRGAGIRDFDVEYDVAVTRVSWDDAVGYCDWAGGCLPSIDGEPPPAHTTTSETQRLREWRDAGTERHKYVLDASTSRLVAVLDRDTRLPNVGFRCAPVTPPPTRRWVFIDGGLCELGTDTEEFSYLAIVHRVPFTFRRPILNRQVRQWNVGGFALADTCVTNEEFYTFTQAARKPWPPYWHASWLRRSGRPFPARLASRPVVDVSAEAVQAYCIWSRCRLPNWFEWEYAASGSFRRPYPWGAGYSATRCNSVESELGSLAAVNDYAKGDSPEGVRQLCGNVSEWVVGSEGQFETRGGSYRMRCELWGLAYAFRQAGFGFHATDVGFRVISD